MIGSRLGGRARRPTGAAVGEVAAGVVAFAAVAGVAAENGGYFPTTWGWAAVALCAIAATLLALGGLPRFRRFEKLLLAAVVGLSVWTFASAIWSTSVTRTMLEGERSLVYASGVLVALLLSRRAGGRAIVIGTWLGVTAVCTYALVTRLFPKQFGVFDNPVGTRLATPVGYWNGLGLLAAIGCLLALGLAARGSVWVRMAAAASTVVLILTLYFTFSRGAWIALLAGLVATFIVDRRRLQLMATALVVAPWPAIAIYYATRAGSLTHVGSSIDAAQKDGHALAAISVILMTLAALAVLGLEMLESRQRLTPGPRLRAIIAAALVCVAVSLVGGLVAHYGGPDTIARKAYHSFEGPPKGVSTTGDLNSRLFSLSSNGRIDSWRVALHERSAHPWLGSGAGTYGEFWFQLRPSAYIIHDAHSLYLETLAETGPIGLALLVLLLAGLIVSAARSRSPFAAVAVGACVAYALHSAADWDWELPALLLAVLFPALAVAGEPAPRPTRALPRRVAPAAAVLAVGAFALFTLLGNIALARSSNASDATDWKQADREARSALDLAPWSAEPWRELAVAQVGLGQIQAARDNLREAVAVEPRDWSLWYQLYEVSTGALHRRALAQADRLNPKRTSKEATPGDLRLVVIP